MKPFSLLILLMGFSLFAQNQDRLQNDIQDSLPKNQKNNIKVGLVLSGGGAKGLAHVGALKVIEKAGVRIDYIGGTSMGAIVGGLYAAGYSAEQLDSIFKYTDFSTLIQDDLPRRVKSFYEKESAKRYALTLPFDHFKLTFPSGLSRGQNIYNLLSQLTYPVRNVNDFTQLPTPFFCIGTDIESGERLVFDHGSLPLAISASGAIPSVFSPVKIGDRLVSDGGITDNFPVEEMKKHDVDYIIGIDVQDSLVDRTKLQTVFQILTQVNNFRTIKAMKNKRNKVDLYIVPDILDFGILSFGKGKEIIKAGQVAALKKWNALKNIAAEQQNPQNKRHIKLKDSVYIADIKIEGNTNFPRNYIRGKLQVNTDEKTSYKKLNEGLENLSATDNFWSVHYRFEPNEKGENNLVLIMNEKRNKTDLRFAAHYDKLYKSSALVNLTHKSTFLKNDIISLDLIIGDNLRYKFDYFVDKGNYWSLGLRSSLNQFSHNVDFNFIKNQVSDGEFNVNKIQLDYFDITNQFYVQTLFFNALRFGVGVEHKFIQLETETILLQDNTTKPFTLLEKANLAGPFAYFEYDNYNHAYFPTKGFYFRGDANYYTLASKASFDFNQFAIVKGKLGFAATLLPKFSARLETSLGFQVGSNEMSALNFFIGGYGNNYVNNIEPFFGYDYLSKSGNSYNKSSIQLDYEVLKKNHIILGYNIANIGDDLLKGSKIFSSPKYTGFSLGYGIKTLLGPLQVFYSYSPDQGNSELFFALGFWF